MIDLIIRNGVVIDGAKTPQYRADVAIQGDRIVQIGNLAEREAHATIDATGKIVAPGFVDVHNHSDGWLLKTPHLFSKTSQGFTTEVIFDADQVIDQATYHSPHQISRGIEYVLVNGKPIIDASQPVPNGARPLPGRALKFKQE